METNDYKKYVPPHKRAKELRSKSFREPKKKRKCCGGILVYSDKKKHNLNIIIIQDRKSKKWGLPKGGKEGEETCFDCASREIMEETGLTVSKMNYEKIRIHSTEYFIILLDSMKKLNPIDTKEIFNIKWINVNDIVKYTSNRELRDLPFKMNHVKNILHLYQKAPRTSSVGPNGSESTSRFEIRRRRTI